MAASNQLDAPARPRRRRRSIAFALLYIAYLLVLVSVGVAAYSYFRTGQLPVGRTGVDAVWYYYYPEIVDTGADMVSTSTNDETIDVLLLGGSVLEQVGERLTARLRDELGQNVHVFNLARSAHTSRDSFLKHERLRDGRFDLIVVYHGINDARMNCVPRGEFRDDYTHCSWYRGFQESIDAKSLNIAAIIAADIRTRIPLGEPEPEYIDDGAEIKTPPAFRRNIAAIVDAEPATPVLLMTFAYHIPEDYSRKEFLAGTLDYGDGHHQLPVELWGRPKNVRRTVDAHNEVIRELAASNDEVLFVDQRAEMPDDGKYFSDVCHLTREGVEQFISNMLPAMVERLNSVR